MAKHEVPVRYTGNELRHSVAFIQLCLYCIMPLKDVLERLRRCCEFVIKSLYNLLIDMHTKCNIIILTMQGMYGSVRKTVRIFDL